MKATTKRRIDPTRRSRIIDSALDVIAVHGTANTTHRRVAEAAEVPLGSMTYHFSDMEELLGEAFTRLAEKSSRRFVELFESAETTEQAKDVVVDIIVGMSSRDLLLSYELYAYAARRPAFTSIMRRWMKNSRIALEKHFDPNTARMLDAFIEGMSIHQSVEACPGGRDRIAQIVAHLSNLSTVQVKDSKKIGDPSGARAP